MPSYFTSLTTPTTVVHGQSVQPPAAKPLADGAFVGEEPPRPGAIDHHRQQRFGCLIALRIALVEQTAFDQRLAERAHEAPASPPARASPAETCPAPPGIARGRSCCAGRRCSAAMPSANATAATPGNASDAALQLLPERVDASVVADTARPATGSIRSARWAVSKPRSTCRSRSRLVRSKRRNDQQRRRDRELRGHETAAQAANAGAAGHGSAGSQRGIHGSAGGMQRRDQAEDQRARDRERGHQPDHRRIETDLLRARKVAWRPASAASACRPTRRPRQARRRRWRAPRFRRAGSAARGRAWRRARRGPRAPAAGWSRARSTGSTRSRTRSTTPGRPRPARGRRACRRCRPGWS